MAWPMRSSTPGSCRKCWPKRLRAFISALANIPRVFGAGRLAALRFRGEACTPSFMRERDGEVDGGGEAAGVGAVGAGEIERGAVIDGGAQDRQAERHVDRAIEAGVLDHGQALVVIHREHGVALCQL